MAERTTSYPELWNVPLRNEHYVKRGDILQKIEAQLGGRGKVLTLVGVAGMGKTQLAKEYAHTVAQKYDIVWWFDASQDLDDQFKDLAIVWNEVETAEKRSNSQLAKEFVLALPDNKEINLKDRIELTRRFSLFFVEKGVAVQLDVHSPHEGEKNWHAHLLVTTRRFSEDGLTFAAKARGLDPVIRGGMVVEANLWGERPGGIFKTPILRRKDLIFG